MPAIVLLIETSLQRGVAGTRWRLNRFNGFLLFIVYTLARLHASTLQRVPA